MHSIAESTKNRRIVRRREPRGGVQIRCVKGTLGLGPNLALSVLDVSETGIRLTVKQPLSIGQEVEISLVGAARGRIEKSVADVIWCVAAADGTHCVGARFRRRLAYADLQELCR
jgi:hypothetical protein